MSPFPRDYLVDNAIRLAQVVARSAAKRFEQYKPREVEDAFDAVLGLSDGSPCDYSLAAIGPMYSLFFHGRRMHDALCHLHAAVKALKLDPTTGILDYGTGTGAVIWALAVLFRRRCLPHNTLPLIIDAYDSSPMMLQEAQALWQDLISPGAFPGFSNLVSVRWYGEQSKSSKIPTCSSRFATAGYVLAKSSTVQNEVQSLLAFVEDCDGDKVALWSSPTKLEQPRQKSEVLNIAAKRGWKEQAVPETNRLAKASFWWKVPKESPTYRAVKALIAEWPSSGIKSRLQRRIDENFTKLSWICTKPAYPLVCLTR